MRKLHSFILILTMLSAAAFQVRGEEAKGAQSFADFWVLFKAAVAKNDKEAVAAMTKFPVQLGDPTTKALFLKTYPEIFNQKVLKCFAKEKPIREQPPQGGITYSLFCKDDIFIFEKVDGKYKLTGRGVND